MKPCKNPDCNKPTGTFKSSGKPRIFCSGECVDYYNRVHRWKEGGRHYESAKDAQPRPDTGVQWEESPGYIKALLWKARQKKKPYVSRCPTCDCPLPIPAGWSVVDCGVVVSGDKHCSFGCYSLRMTDEMRLKSKTPRDDRFGRLARKLGSIAVGHGSSSAMIDGWTAAPLNSEERSKLEGYDPGDGVVFEWKNKC